MNLGCSVTCFSQWGAGKVMCVPSLGGLKRFHPLLFSIPATALWQAQSRLLRSERPQEGEPGCPVVDIPEVYSHKADSPQTIEAAQWRPTELPAGPIGDHRCPKSRKLPSWPVDCSFKIRVLLLFGYGKAKRSGDECHWKYSLLFLQIPREGGTPHYPTEGLLGEAPGSVRR